MYSSGPWPLKILMFALLVTREIATYSQSKMANIPQMSLEQEIDDYIDIKILGVPPPWAGHAFPRQRHMRRGGVIYFCQGFLPCMMPSMDGWKKLHEKRAQCPLLYVNHRNVEFFFN
jgi:hypothetical protein